MAEALTSVILHPVRLRILAALYRRQLTTTQIAAGLPDVPQATLYRHINKLAAGGVLTVVDQRPVRGTLEKTYALTADGFTLSPGQAGAMGPDDWERAFGAFTASLLGQFGAYLGRPDADPVADGVSFLTAPLWLSDTELTRLAADLRAVLLPVLDFGPAPGRRRRLLSTVLVPDIEPDEEGKTS